DYVEGTRLGSEYRTAVEVPDHEWADAERIACANELLVGEAHESIRTFELAQALDEPVNEFVAPRARNKMQDDLGVGGGLHECALVDEFTPQGQSVREVAVQPNRKAAAL